MQTSDGHKSHKIEMVSHVQGGIYHVPVCTKGTEVELVKSLSDYHVITHVGM